MSDNELLNAARDPEVHACTIGDVEHDYRPHIVVAAYGPGRPRTYLRCVWCHAVACGNYGETDPCIEPWHHEPKPHRTRSGVTWPIGGNRAGEE